MPTLLIIRSFCRLKDEGIQTEGYTLSRKARIKPFNTFSVSRSLGSSRDESFNSRLKTVSKILVCLVYLVYLIEPEKPNRPDRPDDQTNQRQAFSLSTCSSQSATVSVSKIPWCVICNTGIVSEWSVLSLWINTLRWITLVYWLQCTSSETVLIVLDVGKTRTRRNLR